MPNATFLNALARSILAGEPGVEQIVARCSRKLGRPWRWLHPLALRYCEAFKAGTRPRRRDIVRFLKDDKGLRRAARKYAGELTIAQWIDEPPPMQPVAAARSWDVPAIESSGALAEWLGVSASELEWYADLKALCRKMNRTRLIHYDYRI